jgi:hypothetical protein
VDQIIEMISMIVMDVVSILGPPSISMIQIRPGGNREHQQLPQWERLVFKYIQCNLDLVTLLVSSKTVTKLHNVTKSNGFMW